MSFPIFYQGKILFREGKPAFSLACCCGGPCIDDCGVTLNGVLLEVRSLTMDASGQFAWSYDDGVDSFVSNQSGPVESLGNCEFRIPVNFIIPPSSETVPGYVYGSYINNIWTFTAQGKTVTFERETNTQITFTESPHLVTMFPNMDPC